MLPGSARSTEVPPPSHFTTLRKNDIKSKSFGFPDGFEERNDSPVIRALDFSLPTSGHQPIVFLGMLQHANRKGELQRA
jgi:hypothetical protein